MSSVEVSVVLPCLNEEKTIAKCVEKIKRVFSMREISGEIIVVDNDSTDNSGNIAKKLGVKIFFEKNRGYGSSYLVGFSNAKGKIVIMGDADNTYDFNEIPKFLKELEKGSDFVIGSRYNGKIFDNAMPLMHRYIGNPLLNCLLNFCYSMNLSDSNCGFRAIKANYLKKMKFSQKNFQFGTEMILNAKKMNLKFAEVPINYYPRFAPSKLRTFKEGFLYLKFILKNRFFSK